MAEVNVLVVEDDELVARAYARVLTREGISVTRASTLPEARALLPTAAWDAVLLDLALGGDSGEDLLKDIPPYVAIAKVAVITATAPDFKKTLSLQARVAAVLPKPFDNESLVKLVGKLAGAQPIEHAVATFAARVGLTRTETEVLRAAAAGLNDAETAQQLQCGNGTVRVHWSNILKKSGMRQRRDLLASLGPPPTV